MPLKVKTLLMTILYPWIEETNNSLSLSFSHWGKKKKKKKKKLSVEQRPREETSHSSALEAETCPFVLEQSTVELQTE